MKDTLIAIGIMTMPFLGMIAGIDYFAAGCRVDTHRARFAQVQPGIYAWQGRTICDQMLIKTAEGERRKGVHYFWTYEN